MGGFLVVIGLALVAAIGVIVLAKAAGDGGTDLRTFWADFRSGLRRRGRDDEDAPVAEEPEPVDVPFDQLFAEASQPDDGYLQLDELAEMLERTGERAARLREHLPHTRAGAGAPAGRVVVQDRVPAPEGADGPRPPHPVAAPARAPRVPRRSGHAPVRTVPGSPAAARPGAGAAVAGPVTLPPAVPPQRGDA